MGGLACSTMVKKHAFKPATSASRKYARLDYSIHIHSYSLLDFINREDPWSQAMMFTHITPLYFINMLKSKLNKKKYNATWISVYWKIWYVFSQMSWHKYWCSKDIVICGISKSLRLKYCFFHNMSDARGLFQELPFYAVMRTATVYLA